MHLSKQKLMELLVLSETWRIRLVASIIAARQSKIGPSPTQYSLLSNSITTHHTHYKQTFASSTNECQELKFQQNRACKVLLKLES
jgi:hypothetical protein